MLDHLSAAVLIFKPRHILTAVKGIFMPGKITVVEEDSHKIQRSRSHCSVARANGSISCSENT